MAGGRARARSAQATFNWAGFISAMGSNITFQSRNVLSKKLMLKSAAASTTSSSEQQAAAAGAGPSSSAACAPAAPLDNISLFSVITCLSFALLLPVNLAVEGWRLSPSALAGLVSGGWVGGWVAGAAGRQHQECAQHALNQDSRLSPAGGQHLV